ncbi:response regulator [Treponema sp. J25]|uniref:response regulator transcription factor n=1 Tax=Treponema sp. J25 TaxID=2094121 RepID=UPI001050AC1A|nr:response regulator [Treponema sp. J25]TCW61468.1 hypothetical protein C5O22_06520 [Treponema sp. J25]
MGKKYSIVIIEDEPAATRYLTTLIGEYCPDFSVVGNAENGETGIQLVASLQPDLVISDIRMPVMDGIEVARRLTESYPDIPLIILSGYSDFEYARQVIHTSVVEYLLKPIAIQTLKDVLGRIKENLDITQRRKQWNYLRSLIRGNDPIPREPSCEYWLALVWLGGTKTLYGGSEESNVLQSQNKINGEGDGAQNLNGGGFPHSFILSGRKSQEYVILSEKESCSFNEHMQHLIEGVSEAPYYTIYCPQQAVKEAALYEQIKTMYAIVDRIVILGKKQIFHEPPSDFSYHSVPDGKVWLYLIQTGQVDNAQRELERILGIMEQEEWRLFEVRSYFNHLFSRLFTELSQPVNFLYPQFTYNFETILAESANYTELGKQLMALVEQLYVALNKSKSNSGMPPVFQEILRYLEGHYHQDVSLSVLAERFRISTSYITKLFKKYTGQTLMEYITYKRIARAVELFAVHPELSVKEVAALVGFEDQCYFSRVFKKITGKSPSEGGASS